MALEIYNTLTRRKEAFVPLDPVGRRVTIYNCGPTIYDHFHVGNARNFVVMDVVRRYLEWCGHDVRFVQNLTDIEDKIIERAQREGVSTEEITERYKQAYFDDAAKLGIRPADVHPRATEYVAQMIELMQRLIEKGLAYEKKGSVYFRVHAYSDYGKLSGRSVDELLEGARVEVNEDKESPVDFVLWKAAKPGEPTWDSPWGEGRPGWHSECCVMARLLLGDTVDIHAGGTDLMFPHHENEIAQHEGLYGKPLARYWMHNGFLNVNSEKMAKSKGNFFKIDEVFAQGYAPETIRLFLLSAVYRNPLDYNPDALKEAEASVRRINEGLETGEKILALENSRPARFEPDTDDEIALSYFDRFRAAMDDDFNTPRAIAVLHEIVGAIHEARREQPVDADRLSKLVGAGIALRDFFGFAPPQPSTDSVASPAAASASGETELPAGSLEANLLALLREMHAAAAERGLDPVVDAFRGQLSESNYARIAGDKSETARANGAIPWTAESGRDARTAIIEALMQARQASRKQKAFDLADGIRDRLGALGIALEDHPQGTIWKLTSTGAE